MIDSYVKAKCITEIDGTPTDGNYKNLFDNWFETDVNFYTLICNKLFGNGKELEKKADDAVAFLLNSVTCSDGYNVQSAQE